MEEMDLNDTFGELNPSNLLNLDDDEAEVEVETEAEHDADADAEVENEVEVVAMVEGFDALDQEPRIGMEFESDEAAKEFYTAYANRLGFSVRMNKSRRSRKDDTVIMRRFVCTKEGFHSKRVIYDDGKKKRKRGTAREGCMAMIEVVKKDPHGRWYASKLVKEHTHLVPMLQGKVHDGDDNGNIGNRNNNVYAGFGSGVLKSCYNNSSSKVVRVNPFGEGGEGQGLLEYLKGRQTTSPGFFYAVQVDNNNCMTNVFWADAKARTAYAHFRDVVTFDTTYKKTKYMMPFACFRGINQHLQSVNFGCCLLMDETKGSYIWLFETWLSAMGGFHPSLLITDKDKAMEGAILRVFPNTSHKFCQSHILSRCKHKLSDAYLKHATLKSDLKGCVTGSGTVQDFETHWEHFLNKYNLWENTWLDSLYQIRDKWVNVYQKSSFFPNLFLSHRQESLNKFFKRNFNAKTSLMVFINCFDLDVASRNQKEAEADFTTVYTKPTLKSPSPIEKQAAEIYTRAVFDVFQEEFVQSLAYYVEEVESDGQISRYTVAREEGDARTQINFVTISNGPDQSSTRASCSCCMFEYSGILCRHVIRVFFIIGVCTLPEEYIFSRWTKQATTSSNDNSSVLSLVEGDGVLTDGQQGIGDRECMVSWYNELCRDGVRFGLEGSVSPQVYKIAKSALERAFTLVMNEKDVQRKGQQMQLQQQSMSRLARVQKMQQQHQIHSSPPGLKVPLPKLQLKKTPTAGAALLEDTASK